MDRTEEGARGELLAMAAQQQVLASRVWRATKEHPVIRGQFVFLFPASEWPAECDDLNAVTTQHGIRLHQLVVSGGWPTRDQVGEDGAEAAWLILQHMDALNDVRRELLTYLRAAVRAGMAPAEHLAAATDRTLLVDGREQLFGTHLTDINGDLEAVRGIEQPSQLNERREALGLSSWDDYLAACRREADTDQ